MFHIYLSAQPYCSAFVPLDSNDLEQPVDLKGQEAQLNTLFVVKNVMQVFFPPTIAILFRVQLHLHDEHFAA